MEIFYRFEALNRLEKSSFYLFKKLLVWIFLLFSAATIFAQEPRRFPVNLKAAETGLSIFSQLKTDTLVFSSAISYHSVIPKDFTTRIDSTTEWKIVMEKKTIAKGIGKKLVDYIFEKPGTYKITYLQKHQHKEMGCKHADILTILTLNVSEIKVTLLFDMSFWAQVASENKQVADQEILVPFRVNYYRKPIEINAMELEITGISCDFKGKSKPHVAVKNNEVVRIPFRCSGTIGSDIYVTLLIKDPIGVVSHYGIEALIR